MDISSSNEPRRRAGAGQQAPRPSGKKARSKAKQKASRHAANQPKPQTPRQAESQAKPASIKKAITASVVFAAAAVAGGIGYAAHNAKKGAVLPTPTKPQDNVSPFVPVDTSKADGAPKVDDGPKAETTAAFTKMRIFGDHERANFKKEVRAKYAESGGVKNAPMGDCIESLAKTNPGTRSSVEKTNSFFDVANVAKQTAETRADNEVSGRKTFKLNPMGAAMDKEANVRYLTEKERADCVVASNDQGAMVDTNGKQLKAGTYLLVIDQDNKIYASPEHKAFVVHHSSFTGGKPVKFGGEMIVGENGKPKEITNASGHYLPTKEAFYAQIDVFDAAGIDTSKSKLTTVTF